MDFILWISKRIKITGSGSSANTAGMTIAVAGVALAFIIMAATLAVMRGFKNQITERVRGFEPDISILPSYDYEKGVSAPYLSITPEIADAIEKVIPDAKPSQAFSQPGILKTDDNFAGVYFQAYDSLHPFTFESKHMADGQLPDFFSPDDANRIAISSVIAQKLQLGVGDKVYAYFFVNDAIKMRRFEIAGIYSTGFVDYDNVTAFAPIATLQKVAGADPAHATRLALPASSFDAIEDEAEALQNVFISQYQTGQTANLYPVDNVKHTGALFFNWLSLLDTNVVVIFALMACVAGFTLISSMFILILDRISTIGLLRALGATRSQIKRIFACMAMKTVGLGLLIGNAVAIGILLVQDNCRVLKLDPEMYYLPYVPVEINWWWMIGLNVAVAIAAWCVLILPSNLAASISPASTLRYE